MLNNHAVSKVLANLTALSPPLSSVFMSILYEAKKNNGDTLSEVILSSSPCPTYINYNTSDILPTTYCPLPLLLLSQIKILLLCTSRSKKINIDTYSTPIIIQSM